jgi:hypothetical protein
MKTLSLEVGTQMKIELEQSIKDLKEKKNQLYDFYLSEIYPYFRFRTLKGNVIDHLGNPVAGLTLRLNQKHVSQTDEHGYFEFDRIFAFSYQISLEWEGVALLNWISGDFRRASVLELKLKWPELIRGQVTDEKNMPIKDLKIKLNDQLDTQSDIHGHFFFPCPDLNEQHQQYLIKLTFLKGKMVFVHHFAKMPAHHQLYKFAFKADELFFLGEYPNVMPDEQYVQQLSQMFKYFKYFAFIVLTLLFVSSFIRISPPKIYLNEEEIDHYTSITPSSDLGDDQVFPNQAYQLSMPKPPSPPIREEIEVVQQREKEQCTGIEFNYQQYYVPWGMEGFLLEAVFGKWQTWQEIAQQNHLKANQGLHAGQMIQLQLPLYSWEMILVKDKQSIKDILEAKNCTELYCYFMIQVWNPHLDVRVLRENDELLYNTELMKKSLENQDEIKKIEGIRRFKGIRFKKPPVKIPPACTLFKNGEKPPTEITNAQAHQKKKGKISQNLKDQQEEIPTVPEQLEDVQSEDSWIYEEIWHEQEQ